MYILCIYEHIHLRKGEGKISLRTLKTRPSKMEVYHRDFKNIIVHTGHIELFEQRD